MVGRLSVLMGKNGKRLVRPKVVVCELETRGLWKPTVHDSDIDGEWMQDGLCIDESQEPQAMYWKTPGCNGISDGRLKPVLSACIFSNGITITGIEDLGSRRIVQEWWFRPGKGE